MNSPQTSSNPHLRCELIIILPLFLLSVLSIPLNLITLDSFSRFDHVKSLFSSNNLVHHNEDYAKSSPSTIISERTPNRTKTLTEIKKEELERSRIAVCLVGAARRFELTGPSIVENILKQYPNAELFLHSPLDKNSFKFSLLKTAPRIASVKIFKSVHMHETPEQIKTLLRNGSPNGRQGLLQYFNLVEGCLSLIKSYQKQKNFTYDWIVRSRVDGYWSGPLDPNNFVHGHYVIPSGSSYAGLNDRLGIGDFKSSIVALSRLSLIPKIYAAGFREINSECAYKAQLTTSGTPYTWKRIPFCIVSDRMWKYPPGFDPPVVAISSPGPLSGSYCRPCTPICNGTCVVKLMSVLHKNWSWTDWEDEKDNFQLCDPSHPWEKGWEQVFDRVAEKKFVAPRKEVSDLTLQECIKDFELMKRNIFGTWDVPPANEICRLGLRSSNPRKLYIILGPKLINAS